MVFNFLSNCTNWCNCCNKEYEDIDEVVEIDDKIYPCEALFVELTNDYLLIIIDGMYTVKVTIFDCNLSKISLKKLKKINKKYRSYKIKCLWMDIGTFRKKYKINSILKNRLAKVYIINELDDNEIDLAKEINSI